MARISILFIMFLLLLAFANRASAGSAFALKATLLKDSYLLQEPVPIRITITNLSHQSQIQPHPGIWYLSNGKECGAGHHPISDPATAPPGQSPLPQESPRVASGWRTDFEYDLAALCSFEFIKEGEYQLEYRIGETVAPPLQVSITIILPTAIDKEAYDFRQDCLARNPGNVGVGYYCDGQLLSKYPTSIYSAWAYIQQFQWWKPASDPATFLKLLLKPDYPPGHFVLGSDGQRIADGKGGYQWQTGKDWMQGLIDRGEPILRAHGNDPYLGPRLRLNVALASMALGRNETAKSLFEEITKSSNSTDLAQQARDYLDALKRL